jgi:proline iminopeptidase
LRPEGPETVEKPTLLLLHGGPGFDHSIFKPAFGSLSDVAQVIYIDLLGQGRSDPSGREHWKLDRWVDDIALFCDALEIKRPIILGVSLGGFVAYGLAARHPDLVGGLISLSSAPRIEVEPVIAKFAELGGAEAGASARRFFDAPYAEGAFDEYLARCMPLYALTELDPDVIPRLRMNPEMVCEFFVEGGEWRSFDYRSSAERFKGPSLIIHGEDDPIVPLEFAVGAAQRMNPETTRIEILPGLRHDVVRDAGDQVLSTIRGFLQENQPA